MDTSKLLPLQGQRRKRELKIHSPTAIPPSAFASVSEPHSPGEIWTTNQPAEKPNAADILSPPRPALLRYRETPRSPRFQQHWSGGGWAHGLGRGEFLGWNLQGHYSGTNGLPNSRLHFPANNRPRSQGSSEYRGPEGGQCRAEVERERESESGRRMQRRRESHVTCAPIRGDGGRSQSEWANPGVGVELWGHQHYRTLPQKWCLEARLPGLQERRIPQWVESGGSTDQQGAPCPRLYHHLRGFTQWEDKQPEISFGASQTQNLKRPCTVERNSHRVMFYQPPSYVSPPPYGALHRTQLGMPLPQK